MQPPPYQGSVYGFRCIRCGNGLELPADLRLMYIDCPYCGTDNVLPPEIVQARQRQYAIEQQHYALQIQEQDRIRASQEKDKIRKDSSRRLLIWLLVGGFFLMVAFGGCMALGIYAQREEDEAKARAQDPKVNGQAALLARFAEMREKQGCNRILVQPSTHLKEASTISLDMIKNDACVHIIGVTGASATLSMKYEEKVALTKPLPAAAALVDYRLCASETATHSFKIEAVPQEPFTTAAIECPRTPAEGGARSGPEDPQKTGKERVQSQLDELTKAGCKSLGQPKAAQRELSLTVTSPENPPCYNLVVASFFSDVKLTAKLLDPAGKSMPVPDPASKIRVEYCDTKAGEYKLTISPSTADFYSYAGVDCPRQGPEGLKRLNSAK